MSPLAEQGDHRDDNRDHGQAKAYCGQSDLKPAVLSSHRRLNRGGCDLERTTANVGLDPVGLEVLDDLVSGLASE